jgi:hypothetical protein
VGVVCNVGDWLSGAIFIVRIAEAAIFLGAITIFIFFRFGPEEHATCACFAYPCLSKILFCFRLYRNPILLLWDCPFLVEWLIYNCFKC